MSESNGKAKTDTIWLYAIQYRPMGMVKLGMSRDRKTLPKRVRDVIGGLPTSEADVLLVMEAPPGGEGYIHHLFDDQHVKGEWFSVSGQLQEFLSGALGEEHLSIVDNTIKTVGPCSDLVAAQDGPRPMSKGDIRGRCRTAILDLACSADHQWIRLYAGALLLGGDKRILRKIEYMLGVGE